ncbi:MAG: ABC transporter permease [Cloacibacillus porcorum]|uniref:ABC transporter permease n=1 Tax=Cloacibacillus porcorum TaxID=1197717 RepID=UPI0023F06C39|nr:ABC transporter permease [Cloacibacillus porcorum]MCD8233669.1 ABC transporter permease [Cloacibacillus porcorum]MCD8391737.1 ABC transporter permease [Cloacibacillus porcorum]MDD7650529.1 ABC transporter permease [Cloacibacillus porcorum]MDY4093406.1 ABC transporter permease [Cloacibacillus porcorum]
MSGRWFLKRLLSSFVVLAAVLVLNFLLFRMMPGDAVSTIIDPSFSPEAKENLRAIYGLDRPLWEQFVIYIRQMLTFSFGLSFLSRKPVWDELVSRLPVTLTLTVSSMALSSALGVWLGIKAALNRGRLAEKIVLRASAVTSSFPGFFVQLVLLMLFARALPIFPLRGTLSVPPPTGALGIFLDYGWHLALPVLSLSLMGFGGWALYVRNLMVRALNEDFALMARARGLSRGRVVWHAFRTILPPILTILLMSVPGLVSGAVITESVFSLHGVGTFLLEAISGHDYPSAGASFYLLALITVFCNLLADITYGLVDPRVRIEGKVQ